MKRRWFLIIWDYYVRIKMLSLMLVISYLYSFKIIKFLCWNNVVVNINKYCKWMKRLRRCFNKFVIFVNVESKGKL